MSYVNLEDHRLSSMLCVFGLMFNACVLYTMFRVKCRAHVVGVNEALKGCKKLQENIFHMLSWLTLKCRISNRMAFTYGLSGFEPQDLKPLQLSKLLLCVYQHRAGT